MMHVIKFEIRQKQCSSEITVLHHQASVLTIAAVWKRIKILIYIGGTRAHPLSRANTVVVTPLLYDTVSSIF